MGRYAAVDLGASSGRVIVGTVQNGKVHLQEVARFPNNPLELEDGLHWDSVGLRGQVEAGLALAAAGGGLVSAGVDSWGVDYGRLDAAGELLEPPFHYRDRRTDQAPEAFFQGFSAAELYRENGLQVQPFNTVFQFTAAAGDPRWAEVVDVLLLPDLFNYWLTGQRLAEVTTASTSGLLQIARRDWSSAVADHLHQVYGLPTPRVLPRLVEPGTVVGTTRTGLFARPFPVVAVGEHDTASAVLAVPAADPDFAYISSGTWSLVGLELEAPVLSESARRANFTNELGPDGTVRFLKNVMGLWVLNECLRRWRERGRRLTVAQALEAAARLPALAYVVDIDDERLLPPGDMPARLRQLAAETGQQLPDDPATITRCVVDSLALAYRAGLRQACDLSGRRPTAVHLVGGGCHNQLLCQLTAEAVGCRLVAGPVEAAALGNLLIQARAAGDLTGDRFDLRRVVAASTELVEYRPGKLGLGEDRWAAAEARLERGRGREKAQW
ncbi:MAG: rhamnulokinase [Propionibacteriaceae bacterium]|jgi:rhamnulokinase|nr:rhamnulokinase [Propionibacteriaceae bacterium]